MPTVELQGGLKALAQLTAARLAELARGALQLRARQGGSDRQVRLQYWLNFVEAGRAGPDEVRRFLQEACQALPRWTPRPVCVMEGCAPGAEDWGGLEYAAGLDGGRYRSASTVAALHQRVQKTLNRNGKQRGVGGAWRRRRPLGGREGR